MKSPPRSGGTCCESARRSQNPKSKIAALRQIIRDVRSTCGAKGELWMRGLSGRHGRQFRIGGFGFAPLPTQTKSQFPMKICLLSRHGVLRRAEQTSRDARRHPEPNKGHRNPLFSRNECVFSAGQAHKKHQSARRTPDQKSATISHKRPIPGSSSEPQTVSQHIQNQSIPSPRNLSKHPPTSLVPAGIEPTFAL